jgi:S-layer family protein
VTIGPGARPVPHWDATALETVTGGAAPKSWILHVGGSFPDVASGSAFYPAVENVLHNGVTAGCGGGLYCPGSTVTRQQMAVFLLKASEGGDYVPPACVTPAFPDVPCSSSFAPWVNELVARGVTAGCGGGNYCPTNPTTREQMAVFLLKTREGSGYTPPACSVQQFDDVPCASGFAAWINELVARGVTAGCGGGNYCPTSSVLRQQMAVFLVKTFGLQLYGL